MGIQFSKYLKIENEIDRLEKMSKILEIKKIEMTKENADSAAKLC